MPTDAPTWEETTGVDEPTWDTTYSGEDVLTAGAKTTQSALNETLRDLNAGAMATPEPPPPGPTPPFRFQKYGPLPGPQPPVLSQRLEQAAEAIPPGTGPITRPLLSTARAGLRFGAGATAPENISQAGLFLSPPGAAAAGVYYGAQAIKGAHDSIKRVRDLMNRPGPVDEKFKSELSDALVDAEANIAVAGEIGAGLGRGAVRNIPRPVAREFGQPRVPRIEPLEFTGEALPGRPEGATVVRPTAGSEVLGPPVPPQRVRTMPESAVTEPEPGREVNMLQEIRDKGIRTKEEVLALFPDVASLPNPRERAAAILRQAYPPERQGPPVPPGGVQRPIGVRTGSEQGPLNVVSGQRPVVEPMRVRQEPVFQGTEIPPEVQAQREREANMQREVEARRSALQQNIIFWERELEMAQNRGDKRGQDKAVQMLLDFRRELEAIPPVKEIAPKPPIARAPGSAFRPEVPGTAAETDRTTVASTVRAKNIKTVEGLLNEYPKMRGTGGSREWARSILREVWGAFPPGVIQGPPLPPAQPPQQPPSEEPPAAPPAEPVPKPPGAPPEAPAAAATPPLGGVLTPEKAQQFREAIAEHQRFIDTHSARLSNPNLPKDIARAIREEIEQSQEDIDQLQSMIDEGRGIYTTGESMASQGPSPRVPGQEPNPGIPQGFVKLMGENFRADKAGKPEPHKELNADIGEWQEAQFEYSKAVATQDMGADPAPWLAKMKAIEEKYGTRSGVTQRATKAAVPETEPTPAATEPAKPATIEDTPIAGKTLGEWEQVRDASQLPKGNARAELAKWLAVPNQPSRILQALGNKKRTREIHAPPVTEVAPVSPEPPQSQAPPVTVAAGPVDMTGDLEQSDRIKKSFINTEGTVAKGKPFTHEGKQYLVSGISWKGDDGTAEGWELIPKSDYKGKVYETKNDLVRAYERNEQQRGNQTGLKVTVRGNTFIMANRKDFRIRVPVTPREAPPVAAPEPPTPPPPAEVAPHQKLIDEVNKPYDEYLKRVDIVQNKKKSKADRDKANEEADQYLSDAQEAYDRLAQAMGPKEADDMSVRENLWPDLDTDPGEAEAQKPAEEAHKPWEPRLKSLLNSGWTKVLENDRKVILSKPRGKTKTTYGQLVKDLLSFVPIDESEIAAEMAPEGPAKPVEAPAAAAMKPEVRAEVDRILGTIEDNQTSVRALDALRSLKNRDQLTIDQFADLEKQVAKLRIEGIRKFNPESAYMEEQKPAMDAIMAQVSKEPGRIIHETGAFKDSLRYVTGALNAAQRRKVRELAEGAGWRFTTESDVDPSYGRGLKTLSFKPPMAKKTAPARALPETAPAERAAAQQQDVALQRQLKGAEKAQAEVSKVAATEGQRPAKAVKAELLKELEDAIAEAPTEEEAYNAAIRKAGYQIPTDAKKYEELKSKINRDKQIGKVTIDIPGDGVFKIWNTKEALTEVLDRAKTISTASGAPVKVTRRNVTKEQAKEYLKEAEDLAKGKPSMGPGAAAAAEFDEPMPPPDPAVYGLTAGNRWWNERVREYNNMVEGFAQLDLFGKEGRGAQKNRITQALNAANTLPRVLGQQAGNSFRLMLSNIREQNAVTALMQAMKMSGQGLEPEDLERLQEAGKLEFAGDPMGYLKANQTDLETYAQEQLNKGMKLEAQAAIDLAQAMQYARDNFAKLKPIATEAKKRLDQQLLSEEARGLETDYERWYVPQRHDLDLMPAAGRPIVLGDSKGAGPSSQFRKAKFYEDYSSAIQAGFIPRSLSIADLIEHRVTQGERLAANKAMFESLKRMRDPRDNKPIGINIPKRKITRPDGTTDIREAVPLDYEPFTVMPGVRMAVHKGYARMLRALTGDSAASESALVSGLQNVAAFEKHVGLAIDTFHLVRTLATELATTGRMSVGSRLQKGTALLEYDIDDLNKAVQQGQISQATADWVTKPQKWEVHGKELEASPRAIVNLGMQNGFNVGRIADNLYKDWISQIPGIGRLLGGFNKLVFQKMTRSAMTHSFLLEFGRVAKQHPEWTGPEVARKVGSDLNVLFGNLQKESWIRSPTLNAIAQITFLAPNWVQSRIRAETRGALQLAEAGGRLLRGKPMQLETAGKTVGTGLLASFAIAQLVNLATRGHLTFQNEEEGHQLDAFLPDPYGGHGFFFSPLAMFAEIMHDVVRYSYTNPDMATAVDQILKNKLGNLGRALLVLGLGRDPYTDEKIIGTENRISQTALQAIPLPIIGSTAARTLLAPMVPGTQRPTTADIERQAYSSFGVKVEPAPSASSQIRRMVDEWKMTQEPKLQADVERRQKEEFRSTYSDLRGSLSRGDMGQAGRAYHLMRSEGATPQQIRKTINHPAPFAGSKALERRFFDSLTPQQQQVYERAIQERELIQNRFQQMLETQPQLEE